MTDDWQNFAACLGCDPALWFPSQDTSNSEAKAVCNTCPVQRQCLNYALDNRELFGIWGGKSYRERRTLRYQQLRAGRECIVPYGEPFPPVHTSSVKVHIDISEAKAAEVAEKVIERLRARDPANWVHGTDAAYRQHSRYGIPICEPCRQAHRDNRPGAA